MLVGLTRIECAAWTVLVVAGGCRTEHFANYISISHVFISVLIILFGLFIKMVVNGHQFVYDHQQQERQKQN